MLIVKFVSTISGLVLLTLFYSVPSYGKLMFNQSFERDDMEWRYGATTYIGATRPT
jgi:hypothetical protein